MFPTSLDVAGFAPAEGTLSSQTPSFGSSQQEESDASAQGASFRQVMSSYARSDEESQSDESRAASASRRSEEDKAAAARSKEETNSNSASVVTDQPTSTPPASSFTGAFGVRRGNQEQEEEEAAESATAAAASEPGGENGEGAAPQAGSGTQFTGLSALQMLLQGGGSLTQLATSANLAPFNQPTAAGSSFAAGGHTAKLTVGKSFPSGWGAAAGAKSGKSKTDESKRTADGTGTSAPDLPLLATNAVGIEPRASEAESNGAEAAKSRLADLALSGSTREQLHLGAAGDKDNPVNAAANNFAFAVRLTADRAAAVPTESNDASAAGPLALGAAAQPAGIAVVASAELADAGTHTGEHAGEGGEPGGMMWGAETAPASPTGETNSASKTEDPAPVVTAEPEAAAQTEPVRNVRLQLAGDNNQRVDIRLVDVGGEMRVSVRAGDTKLAQSLQEHLPDLSTKLNQQSVRAEVWSPRTETTEQANSSNQSGQSSRGDTPNQGGGQQGQRQGNGRQQQNQPDWVDELENYSSPATTTRSNQAWPQ